MTRKMLVDNTYPLDTCLTLTPLQHGIMSLQNCSTQIVLIAGSNSQASCVLPL